MLGCVAFDDFWLDMQAVELWRLVIAFGTSMYEYVCTMTICHVIVDMMFLMT
jgi:hypothetical protein